MKSKTPGQMKNNLNFQKKVEYMKQKTNQLEELNNSFLIC